MKTILKILKRFAIILLAVMACIYLFFELGGYCITNKAERGSMAKTIKQAPALPDNFLRVYGKVYSGALDSTMWGYVFKKGFSRTDFRYPARDTAVEYCIHNRNGGFLSIAFTAFLIEDHATPQQCLQFNMSNCYLTRNITGVEAASQYYFKKWLKDITDEQVLELLVMMKNPGLYDKHSSSSRRVKLFYKALAEFRKRLSAE
ncbi:MAG: transglycosylase domain-containing protein [Bacteroidota bacterium]